MVLLMKKLLFIFLFSIFITSNTYPMEQKIFYVDCEGRVSIYTEKSGTQNKNFVQTYEIEVSKLNGKRKISALRIIDTDTLMLRPSFKYYWTKELNPSEVSVDFTEQNNALLTVYVKNLKVGVPTFAWYQEKLNLRTGNMHSEIAIKSNNDSIGSMYVEFKGKCNGGKNIISYMNN